MVEVEAGRDPPGQHPVFHIKRAALDRRWQMWWIKRWPEGLQERNRPPRSAEGLSKIDVKHGGDIVIGCRVRLCLSQGR